MRRRITDFLDDFLREMITTTVLCVGLFLVGVLYGIYNIPSYQDVGKLDVIIEQTKLSIPPAFIATSFIVFVTQLLNFILISQDTSHEREIVLDLKSTVQSLVNQNRVLLAQLERDHIDVESEMTIV